MRNFFLGLSFCLALTGCDHEVNDFVRGGGDPPREGPSDSGGGSDAVVGIKVSPGRVTASSASVSMSATVTPTRRRLSGTGVSAEITLSGARSQ